MTEEKILDKLQKLIAMRDSAQEIGNLEEAEAFAQKVSAMLLKHNLSMFDIKQKDDPNIIKNKFFANLKNPKNEGKWIYQLYSSLCDVNNCKLVSHSGADYIRGRVKKVEAGGTIFGEPENIEVVVFLAEQLESKVRFLAAKAWAQVKSDPWEKRNRFLRAYFRGAVAGIYSKLLAQQEQQKRENSNVTALVICRKEQLEKAVNERFNDLKDARKSSPKKGSIGSAMGYEDGKKMDINKGISAETDKPNSIE